MELLLLSRHPWFIHSERHNSDSVAFQRQRQWKWVPCLHFDCKPFPHIYPPAVFPDPGFVNLDLYHHGNTTLPSEFPLWLSFISRICFYYSCSIPFIKESNRTRIWKTPPKFHCPFHLPIWPFSFNQRTSQQFLWKAGVEVIRLLRLCGAFMLEELKLIFVLY